MANGIINLGSTRDVLEGRIVWSSVSNGSVANTSNVTAELQMRRNDGYTTTGTWNGSLNIGGQVETFSTHQSIGTSWVSLISFTKTISHSSDGTGTCYLYAKGNGPSGTSMAGHYVEGSQTVTLDRIARASTVTCPDGNIGSSTIININRSSDNFTHTLRYSFGNLTGTIVTKTNQTSYGWTIPTTFYAQIPNVSNGTGTVFCDTYSGNTLVGTSTTTFKAFVVNSNPTISATIIDTNSTTTTLTGNNNKLVKYYSNAKVTLTATARNSATIVQKRINGEVISGNDKTINNVEIKQFTVDCTDSRGFVGTATYTKSNSEWVEYVRLALTNVTIARTGSTSNTVTATVRGNYYNGSFGSQNNSLTLRWRYKEKNGTYSGYTTVTATLSGNTFSYSGTLGTNFDYQKEYIFEVQAIDKLVTVTRENTVTAGIPLIDIWKDNVAINGRTTNKYGSSVIALSGGSGTAGYMHVCRITVNRTYANQDMIFRVLQRGRRGEIILRFESQNTNDPTINNFLVNGNIKASIVKASTSNWDLYVEKSEGWDELEVTELHKGNYMSAVSINWINQTVTSLPSGYTNAKTERIIKKVVNSDGGNWILGRDNATAYNQSYGQSLGNSYNTVACQKTSLGAWNIGNLSGEEDLLFLYTTDANYSSKTNKGMQIRMKPVPTQTSGAIMVQCTLYNNATGTTGTVTLNDSSANYNFMEIYCLVNDRMICVKIVEPNGKKTGISYAVYSDTEYNSSITLDISGTTITPSLNKYWYSGTVQDNKVKIVRVDGWK